MESLEAISAMNDKHPPGRRSTSIDNLVARVRELEKENAELRTASEKAQEGPCAPRSATLAPALATKAPRPSDAALCGFLATYPRRSLSQICERFGVAWGGPPSYTEGAREIRNQLQRLRRAGKIRSEGQRWMI